MKRTDYILLPLIGLFALFLGWKLFTSTSEDLSGMTIQPLDDIGAFVNATEKNTTY